MWRQAPQGDPGDRRARGRQHSARAQASSRWRPGLTHQDLDRQGDARSDTSVTLVMLRGDPDFERSTGRQVGMKPAGGIRVAKEAIQYPRGAVRDPRAALDVARLVPLRGLEPAQRRADADREGADRPLPGPGPLHARLTHVSRDDAGFIEQRPLSFGSTTMTQRRNDQVGPKLGGWEQGRDSAARRKT